MRRIFALLLFSAPAVFAQTATPIVSPEVLPDHRVVFRLRAPQANEVTIAGDYWVQQNRTEKLSKDASGIWSLTTEPLPPDLYSYWFTVDGVAMPDPANGQLKQGIRAQQSMFAVPGPDESYLEPASVPHGEVQTVYYPSPALGRLGRMRVYLPPGYEKRNTRYPVVYLFHGGGDDDWGWVDVGRVNFILDNLIAQGKAKPMIVVMPSMWALKPPVAAAQADENATLFQTALFDDVMPYVDGHYRVLSGASNRAAGGLGPGREFLPNFLWPTLGKFGYVFFVSGGANQQRVDALEKQYPDAIDDPAHVKGIRFFLGDGSNDSSVGDSRFLAAEFKRHGYRVTAYETGGTHGWPSFRRCFAQWAQTAFQ